MRDSMHGGAFGAACPRRKGRFNVLRVLAFLTVAVLCACLIGCGSREVVTDGSGGNTPSVENEGPSAQSGITPEVQAPSQTGQHMSTAQIYDTDALEIPDWLHIVAQPSTEEIIFYYQNADGSGETRLALIRMQNNSFDSVQYETGCKATQNPDGTLQITDSLQVKLATNLDGSCKVTYPDKTVFSQSVDNRLEFTYPDKGKAVQAALPGSGRFTFLHPDGDYVPRVWLEDVYNENREKTERQKTGESINYLFSDGTRFMIRNVGSTGRMELVFPDGTQINVQGENMSTIFANGTSVRVVAGTPPKDGNTDYVLTLRSFLDIPGKESNNAVFTNYKDRNGYLVPDGEGYLYPDGTHIVLDFPDSSSVIQYPDGVTTKVNQSNNRVSIYSGKVTDVPNHYDWSENRVLRSRGDLPELLPPDDTTEEGKNGEISGEETSSSGGSMPSPVEETGLTRLRQSFDGVFRDLLTVAALLLSLVAVVLILIGRKKPTPELIGTTNTHKGERFPNTSQDPTPSQDGFWGGEKHTDPRDNPPPVQTPITYDEQNASIIRVSLKRSSWNRGKDIVYFEPNPRGKVLLEQRQEGYLARPETKEGLISESVLFSDAIKDYFDVVNNTGINGKWLRIDVSPPAILMPPTDGNPDEYKLKKGTIRVIGVQNG